MNSSERKASLDSLKRSRTESMILPTLPEQSDIMTSQEIIFPWFQASPGTKGQEFLERTFLQKRPPQTPLQKLLND